MTELPSLFLTIVGAFASVASLYQFFLKPFSERLDPKISTEPRFDDSQEVIILSKKDRADTESLAGKIYKYVDLYKPEKNSDYNSEYQFIYNPNYFLREDKKLYLFYLFFEFFLYFLG